MRKQVDTIEEIRQRIWDNRCVAEACLSPPPGDELRARVPHMRCVPPKALEPTQVTIMRRGKLLKTIWGVQRSSKTIVRVVQ